MNGEATITQRVLMTGDRAMNGELSDVVGNLRHLADSVEDVGAALAEAINYNSYDGSYQVRIHPSRELYSGRGGDLTAYDLEISTKLGGRVHEQ